MVKIMQSEYFISHFVGRLFGFYYTLWSLLFQKYFRWIRSHNPRLWLLAEIENEKPSILFNQQNKYTMTGNSVTFSLNILLLNPAYISDDVNDCEA